MNNGITAAGVRRKEAQRRIYGAPKGSAQKIGQLNKTEWEYRGFRLHKTRNAGWAAGATWYATNGTIGFSDRSKEIVMVKVDWHHDGKPERWQ